jgi:NitT/TauT family transport system substrate-binding protein
MSRQEIKEYCSTGQRDDRRGFLCAAAQASALGWASTLHLPSQAAKPWPTLKPEKSKITVAVNGKGGFASLPLVLALQLGYFADEGLEVDIEDMAGAARVQQSVFSGAADVASGSFEHILALAGKGLSAQEFVLLARAPQIAFGVSTRSMQGFKRTADLRGKRVGVSAPGMPTHVLVQRVLLRAGLRPEDVSIVGVGTSAGALAALRSGQIDALSNIDPVMTLLELKAEVKIIADARTVLGTQAVFDGPMPSGCLYASSDFLLKHPQTSQALAYAVVRALKWLQTAGPTDLLSTVPEAYLLGDRALYLAAFDRVREGISTDGVLSAEAVGTAYKVTAQFESSGVMKPSDLGKTFTNAFALLAKKRYAA